MAQRKAIDCARKPGWQPAPMVSRTISVHMTKRAISRAQRARRATTAAEKRKLKSKAMNAED